MTNDCKCEHYDYQLVRLYDGSWACPKCDL
jgi:hypothetical protein